MKELESYFPPPIHASTHIKVGCGTAVYSCGTAVYWAPWALGSICLGPLWALWLNMGVWALAVVVVAVVVVAVVVVAVVVVAVVVVALVVVAVVVVVVVVVAVVVVAVVVVVVVVVCLLYTSPSPRDQRGSRMPSSA